MQESLFIQEIEKWFPGIVLNVVERLNDTERPNPYYHRRMLTKQYSHTGKWESLSANYSIVAADVVAMDSQIPLKKRDSMGSASGDIPKMGLKLMLNENQLTKLHTLRGNIALGSNAEQSQRQIINTIFEDTPRVIQGVWERNEKIFLEALSTGICIVDDDENTGVGIRVDFGYKDENKFGVTALWSDSSNAKPLNDIDVVVEKAREKGHTITSVKLDRVTARAMLNTAQVKQAYGFFVGFNGDNNNLQAPALDRWNQYMAAEYGFTFEIIERSVVTEKNGIRTSHKPWSEGKVIFLTSDNVGDLVYSFVAEMLSPDKSVTYQVADDMVLVSKYRKNDPLTEFTSSQARVLPVLANVDSIYQLDAKVVNE